VFLQHGRSLISTPTISTTGRRKKKHVRSLGKARRPTGNKPHLVFSYERCFVAAGIENRRYQLLAQIDAVFVTGAHGGSPRPSGKSSCLPARLIDPTSPLFRPAFVSVERITPRWPTKCIGKLPGRSFDLLVRNIPPTPRLRHAAARASCHYEPNFRPLREEGRRRPMPNCVRKIRP